jgi:muconolactone D-isomerase
MEFLVEISVHLPPDLPEVERTAIIAAERARGRALRAQGAIAAIWRVPGGMRNVGIWQAADATELHALLSSLPLHRYMDVDVTPLARHPLDEPE